MGHRHRPHGWYWIRREEDAELEVARLGDEGWTLNDDIAARGEKDHGFWWSGDSPIEPPRQSSR